MSKSGVWFLTFEKERLVFKKYPVKKTKKKSRKKSKVVSLFFMFLLVLLIPTGFISAAIISDDLHLNIQTVNSTGAVVTGTFDFVFNITNVNDCTNLTQIVYSNSTNLTTDSRGIISYYLPNVTLDYDRQYWLCHYRNGTLQDTTKIARTPYTFGARNVSGYGIINDSNIDLTNYNFTGSYGLFTYLGSLLNRITGLFATSINVSGNATFDTNTLFIDSVSNRVGIGTTSPSSQLHVVGDIRTDANVYVGNSLNDGLIFSSGGDLRTAELNGILQLGIFTSTPIKRGLIGQTGQGTDIVGGDLLLGGGRGTGTGEGGSIIFQIANTSSSGTTRNTLVDKMIIDSSGKLGINTTTPQNLLNVLGDANITGLIYGNGSQLTGVVAEDSQLLDGFDSTFFFPLNTSVTGTFDFNGGWQSNGVTISGGDILAQTGFFYNITSLNVNQLEINGSLLPQAPFENVFDIGSGSLRWRDLFLGRNLYSNGSAIFEGDLNVTQNLTVDINTLFVDGNLGRVGIGTTSPSEKLDVQGNATLSALLLRDENDTSLTDWALKVDEDAVYAPGNALYIYNVNSGQRLFFGKSGSTIYAINFKYVVGGGLEELPTLNVRNSASNFIGIGGSSHSFRRANDDLEFLSSGSSGGDFRWRTNTTAYADFSSSSEIMTLLGTGELGIGTTTPQNLLNVLGDANITGEVKVGTNVTLNQTGITFSDATIQTTAASGGVPSNAVMFFNLAACPTSWTELTTARGLYIVGLPASGTLAATVGTALTNKENRTVGQHNHGITDPGHTHDYMPSLSGGANTNTVSTAEGTKSVSAAVTGITIDNEGSVAGTNAPFIQLLVCEKD